MQRENWSSEEHMAREMKVGEAEEFKFVVRRLEYCQKSIYGIGMASGNKFMKLFQYKHYHIYDIVTLFIKK